jgi:hypothetical protein
MQQNIFFNLKSSGRNAETTVVPEEVSPPLDEEELV